ncbi:hypothetical protein FT663_01430 [Candidozyma haemuli var. vulneris]|uniref:tRNA wybutosine-synthesizing protein 4 n=1 Tax=Candidozyma haemuli TaxID=45357 RepID=A0A2V1AP32_9ASCO|nr:hypothetical protein CXQ85_003455 [[Candida] haemuloni]KAF3991643.1 hypothetical protein FT662_01641 [[Candida] haemuloni var. vulneris]KAF3994411.1 hypothetical protein FT663_01430 [[Candida] haemuloni var. vulneris]PVH19608.1 hypothetical protein CXQ85_003455 [[Candida] haemuloni]
MPQTPEQVLANNRRKIEKDKRRLVYHDLQVQGTNNSSIVSKRSVEAIYNPILEPGSKEWIKHFVPKAKRRSPAINRGYWIRMESIKQMILRIRQKYAEVDAPVRIVNLGCGFDTLPFQFLETQQGKYEFYDFDYPELVQRKLAVIKESEEILSVIGSPNELTPVQKDMGITMATDTYKLVGCDLKDTKLYQKQLESLLPSSKGAATIFIAEVSLAYMKPEDANPVIEISSTVDNSHFLVLEQIMPSGPHHFFAEKMLYHFSHLRSPLQCVETYSTKEKQTERFAQYFSNVEIRDLFECWKDLVDKEKKKLVDEVEAFDEWEEFIVFCQHYVVIHATNSKHLVFRDTVTAEPLTGFNENVDLSYQALNGIELKFPGACEDGQGKHLVFGGMFQSRENEIFEINDGSRKPVGDPSSQKPSARMCHTFTNVGDGLAMMAGGRSRPGLASDDIWVYDLNKLVWKQSGELPVPMYRHSAVCTGVGELLVFGEGQFTKYDDGAPSLNLSVVGNVPSLKSCAMTYDSQTQTGYIVGGMVDHLEPFINNQVYRYSLNETQVTVEPVFQSEHLARVGCNAIQKDHLLVVIGGAGSALQDQDTTIVVINTTTWSLEKVHIPDDVWKTAPVFIGSALSKNTILVGGAVCYSFGSAYSGQYEVVFK